MAITSCGAHGLERDTRFKAWGKIIRNAGHVDLSKTQGYALAGEWVRWDEEVSLNENEFLVVASEIGSIKNHDYKYRLIEGAGAGKEARRISKEERHALIEAAFAQKLIDEPLLVKHRNAVLYSYAVYCHLRFQGFKPQTAQDKIDAAKAEVERLEAALAAAREALAQAEHEAAVVAPPSGRLVADAQEANNVHV
jgi:hypothetical protein